MPLIDYSSDVSDEEKQPEPAKSKPNITKPAFQKVVDRSNPNKIRISLPEPSETEQPHESERPSKRAKVGAGGFSGFNSLLPAPKRAAAPNGGASTGVARTGGLGSGANLKTGTAPGFSREPAPSADAIVEDGEEVAHKLQTDGARKDTSQDIPPMEKDLSVPKPAEEPKISAKTTMFKPLSVARKPQKKKAPPVTDGLSGIKIQGGGTAHQPKAVPKVSLFSTGEGYEASSPTLALSGTYQPMVYTTSEPNSAHPTQQPEEDVSAEDYSTASIQHTPDQKPQSLTSIATDLNLTASQKRQLLGRQGQKNDPNASTINIVNFNTDKEYAANEALRQAGETVQHNPVRAIAPGKHSLKQLVNAASNQKDALEESFASGRRNKREAGSKYGW